MDRRTFLLAAVANGALAAAPAAFAATPLEGKASRLSPQSVRLDWDAKEPVSIYQSGNPDAPRQAMSRVKTAVAGGADLPAAVSPRPYFLIETKGGQQTRVAERLLPLQGGRNFRDIGGYRTTDGRQVRWGKIYRSGVMAGLTLADMTYLSRLGVSVICDLRSPQERNAEPTPFLKVDGVEVIAIDYNMDMSLGGLAKMQTREQAIQGFAQAYVGFLDILTPHYTELFARLAAGKAPLAFNCSAGKDRTGMGAALVLSVLGVPRETIVADYALTQVYTPPSMYKAQMASASGAKMGGMTAEQLQAFARMPPEVLDVMMGSDPGVMRSALAAVDAKYGGPVALTKARFGMTDEKIAAMRKAYLA